MVLTNQVKKDPFEAVRQYLQSQANSKEFLVCSLSSLFASCEHSVPKIPHSDMETLISKQILVNGVDIFSLPTMSVQKLYYKLYGCQKDKKMTQSELLNIVVARLLLILKNQDENE